MGRKILRFICGLIALLLLIPLPEIIMDAIDKGFSLDNIKGVLLYIAGELLFLSFALFGLKGARKILPLIGQNPKD